MRKSSAGVLQETDLSFLFSEFFEAFSATENGTLYTKNELSSLYETSPSLYGRLHLPNSVGRHME